MNNADALILARKAREDKIINRLTRDSVTGELFTIRERIEKGAYAFRTRHIQTGKRITYGLVLATEVQWALDPIGAVDYMTPVCIATKIAYDYASDLPVLTFDENTCRVIHGEW